MSVVSLNPSISFENTVFNPGKFFSEIDTAARILLIFEDALKKQRGARMTPSAQGLTGFTFLCILPIEPESGVDNLRFVLKWEYTYLTQNEKLCADLLKQKGFQTPQILDVTSCMPESLAARARLLKPALASNLSVIAMNYFPGSTLAALVQNNKLRFLTEDAWKSFMISCGKIALYDLLIGNTDRFIRLDMDDFEQNPTCNSGNILLELNEATPPGESKEKHKDFDR